MIETIWHIIFEQALATPGGLLLWIATGKKGKLSDYLTNNQNKSIAVGLVIWVTVMFVISLVAKIYS
ncbi:MAG: hypothetical protein KDD40_12635 [Bdellovibrionales bacterium]|nr:hypothetical protein [Bdellovibrionales bacterium]